MPIKILKLDSNDEVVAVLPNGIHNLGRGDLLKCQDKRISRNHAELDVRGVCAELRSTHINPCFYKKGANALIAILTGSNTILLNDGDRFGFLPDMFWFKVKFGEDKNPKVGVQKSQNESETPIADNNSNNHLKRSHEHAFSAEEGNGKRGKPYAVSPNEMPTQQEVVPPLGTNATMDTTVLGSQIAFSEIKIENEGLDPQPEQITPDHPIVDLGVDRPTEIKEEPTDKDGPKDEEEPKDKEQPKDKEDTKTDGPGVSVNANKQKRERCWYGATCYRKNPIHRSDFSHPGDTDFLSDPEDDRPHCSFGAQCYRTNKIHRREYKHPPGPQKPPKKAKKRAPQNQTQTTDLDDFLDDDDVEEDPYADDGDESDEYVAESDSSSSDDYEDERRKRATKKTDDSEASQSLTTNPDSEDFNLLLEEAKKFTKD